MNGRRWFSTRADRWAVRLLSRWTEGEIRVHTKHQAMEAGSTRSMGESGDQVMPFWLAGHQAGSDQSMDVTHPDGTVVGRVAIPTDVQIEQAVAAAHEVRAES